MLGAAAFLACRMIRVPAGWTVAVLAALLLQIGVLNPSAVPGVAQIADAKAELDNWTDKQVELNSARAGQPATETAYVDSAQQDCAVGLY